MVDGLFCSDRMLGSVIEGQYFDVADTPRRCVLLLFEAEKYGRWGSRLDMGTVQVCTTYFLKSCS